MRSSDHHHHKRQRERSRSRSREKEEHRYEKYQPRFKLQQTRTLMLEGVSELAKQLQSMFTDLSISIGTSIPDELQVQGGKLFLKYPSVEAAMSVMEHLKGQATYGDKKIKIQYYPIRKVDLNVAYDWYCDKCDYKNFARRNRCYRCQSDKTATCRLSYSTQPASRPLREESAQNCSLMIRGPVVSQIDENLLLQIFQSYAPVRDIRQIKNKLTGTFKDFAFIEFFSPQETSAAFHEANDPNFKINGQKVTVMYSRNKSQDDYVKPLPYQSSKREKKNKDKVSQQDNYYHRQRQREIEQEKARPSITMEQLKQKREQEMKKNMPLPKEMNQEQSKRRQAQLLAKQWQREMKVQVTMYICPACNRKFQNLQQMKLHQKLSEFHKFHMSKIQNISLSL